MDLDKLKTFYHVVKEGGIQAAEKSLHLSASSISRQIQSVESDMGMMLFTRTRLGLKVNESGQALYETVKNMLNQIATTQNILLNTKNSPQGSVACVSSRDMGEQFLMPSLLRRIIQSPLKLTCCWDDAATYHFDSDLNMPTLYIAEASQNANPSMIQEKVGRYSLKAVASKEYLQNFGKPTKAIHLDAHHLISYAANSCFYSPGQQEVNKLLTWETAAPRLPFMKVNSFQAAVTAVHNSVGIALVPDYLIEENMEELFQDLTFIPWRKSYDLYAFYREEYRGFERILLLKQMIRSVFQEHDQAKQPAQVRYLNPYLYSISPPNLLS